MRNVQTHFWRPSKRPSPNDLIYSKVRKPYPLVSVVGGKSLIGLFIPLTRSGQMTFFLRKIPECAVDTFLPSPSPFGMDYLAHLSQLKFLESWGPTLDALAPAYKASIWRVAKIFKEFGSNHDMTSFRKTIARWSQSPLENLDSIRLLFCAIGYLKNAGVIKHEFFYPTSGDCLYPVFRSECNDSEKKRKRRKRKRSFLEPSKENPIQIDMKIGTPHHERPMNAQKLTQTWPSAFRPVQAMHSKKTATAFPKESGDNWSIPLIPKLPTTDVYQNYVSAPSSKRSKLDTGLAPLTWPSPPSHSPSHSPTSTESTYRTSGLSPYVAGVGVSERFPKLPPLMGVCKDTSMSGLPRLAPLLAPCDDLPLVSVRSWPLPPNYHHTFGITHAKA